MTKTNGLRIFQDSSFVDSLDDIQIASPCHAAWGDMVGSDKVRFCASCQKNVFNLSGMQRTEAIELLRATEGKACVRFYRRADGTVLTEDCPVGVQLLLKKAKRMTLAAAAVSVGAVAALLAVLGGAFGGFTRTCERLDEVKESLNRGPEMPMGAVAMPPPGEPGDALMGDVDVPDALMGEVAPAPPVPQEPVMMGKPSAPRMGRVQPRVVD